MSKRTKKFRVTIPVLLDLEVETTEDPLTALRIVREAFKLADPLLSTKVRVVARTSLNPLPEVRVIDARPQGPPVLKPGV